MSEQPGPQELSLEERVARLEGALGWLRLDVPLNDRMFIISFCLLLVACVVGIAGLGWPNHYYQIVFALLTVMLAYHRGWLAMPQKAYQWSIPALNVIVLAMLFKLVIGAGRAQPLSWIKLPHITTEQAEESGKWLDIAPNWTLSWQDTAITDWIVDLTIIQTFLFVITLIGALFEFQPFASLIAFLLILFSIPALFSFNWTWVCPALIVASVAFYLQTSGSNVPAAQEKKGEITEGNGVEGAQG